MPSWGFWRITPTYRGRIRDVLASPVGAYSRGRRQGSRSACRVRRSCAPEAHFMSEKRGAMGSHPLKRRQPYGRHWLAHRLVTEPGIRRRPASSFVGQAKYVVKSYPMPRGGVRWTARCYRCCRRVCHLYGYTDREQRDWGCRRCLSLRYWSQYQGRAPEADLSRILILIERAKQARSPAVRERRLVHAAHSLVMWERRERRFQQRVAERARANEEHREEMIERRMARLPKRFRIRL
jgi:hypothetical protein